MPLQVQEIDYREADADADANMHLDGTTAYAVALAGGGYASSPQRHRGNGGKSGGSPGRRRAGRGGARQGRSPTSSSSSSSSLSPTSGRANTMLSPRGGQHRVTAVRAYNRNTAGVFGGEDSGPLNVAAAEHGSVGFDLGGGATSPGRVALRARSAAHEKRVEQIREARLRQELRRAAKARMLRKKRREELVVDKLFTTALKQERKRLALDRAEKARERRAHERARQEQLSVFEHQFNERKKLLEEEAAERERLRRLAQRAEKVERRSAARQTRDEKRARFKMLIEHLDRQDEEEERKASGGGGGVGGGAGGGGDGEFGYGEEIGGEFMMCGGAAGGRRGGVFLLFCSLMDVVLRVVSCAVCDLTLFFSFSWLLMFLFHSPSPFSLPSLQNPKTNKTNAQDNYAGC